MVPTARYRTTLDTIAQDDAYRLADGYYGYACAAVSYRCVW